MCLEGRKALVEMLEAQSAENLADDLLNKGVQKNKAKGQDKDSTAVQADSGVAFPQVSPLSHLFHGRMSFWIMASPAFLAVGQEPGRRRFRTYA